MIGLLVYLAAATLLVLGILGAARRAGHEDLDAKFIAVIFAVAFAWPISLPYFLLTDVDP